MEHQNRARRRGASRRRDGYCATAGRGPARPGFAGRWGGLIASVVVGLVFLGVIWWSVWNRPAPTSANGQTDGANAQQPGQPVEVLPPAQVTGPIATIDGQADKMYVEVTAKDDPNKLVAVIEADEVEPIDENERSVQSPRAWIYFEDGTFGRVDADQGRFYMPDRNSAPESGLLEGNVVLRVYGTTETGEPPETEGPDAATPQGTATFEEALRFDFRRSRISSSGGFTLLTPSVEMAGTNLTAIFNEVQQRLELLEVREGEYVRFTPVETATEEAADAPSSAGETRVAAGSPGANTPAPATNTPAEPAPAPIETFYHLTFLDGVDVRRDTQSLRGDRLDVWVRMLDNALTEGAILPLRATSAQSESAEAVASNESNANADDAAPVVASAATPAVTTEVDADGAVVMRWTGPMRLQPLGDERPDVLAQEEVALSLTAERTGFVSFEDAANGGGASARAVGLDYGFTTGELVMSGPGGNVRVSYEDAGELEGSRVVASMGTGLVHVRGPGVLRALGEETDESRRTTLRWSEQADFAFAREGEAITNRLDSATLLGAVEGTNGSARLEGERLVAGFVEGDNGRSRLASVEVEAGRASDREGGSLQGDVLTVLFGAGTTGHDLDPQRVEVFGSARAENASGTLTARELYASLGRTLEGELRLEGVEAEEDVIFTDADGLSVRTASLAADALSESVELRGAGSVIESRGATITGSDLRVDARNRRARVIGTGSFEQTLPEDEGGGRVTASWIDTMTFDDYTGQIECVGGVVVESRAEALERDLVKSERIVLTLSPFREGGDSVGSEERELWSAVAYGSADGDGNPLPASVESRVFATERMEVVERMLFLEGMRIELDTRAGEGEGVLTVPGAGKLLLLDRRERSEDEPATEAERNRALMSELASGGPGLTRFEWRGGMSLSRGDGVADMTRSVRVTHKNLLSGETYQLHSERLTAVVLENTGESDQLELVRGEASGAVYFGSSERELIADRLLYDAANGVVIGTAAEGNLVTLFDATRGTPLTSRAIRWDLENDVISVERPGAVVTPVGP